MKSSQSRIESELAIPRLIRRVNELTAELESAQSALDFTLTYAGRTVSTAPSHHRFSENNLFLVLAGVYGLLATPIVWWITDWPLLVAGAISYLAVLVLTGWPWWVIAYSAQYLAWLATGGPAKDARATAERCDEVDERVTQQRDAVSQLERRIAQARAQLGRHRAVVGEP
jgi:hypothetical protein